MTAESRPGLHALLLAGVLALATAAYANAPTDRFVYDEQPIIKLNPRIRTLDVARFFREDMWWDRGVRSALYRPLFLTSLAVDHAIWGLDPAGFRVTNVILHLAVCAALLAFLLQLGAAWPAAAAGAAVFAVHPVHTEVVANAANRSELLGTLCYLGGLIAVSALVVRRGRLRLGWSLAALAYAVGLLCRESTVTFPAAAALLLWLHPRTAGRPPRDAWLGLVLLLAPLGGYLFLRAAVLGQDLLPGAGQPPAGLSVAERAALVASALVDYVRLLFAPWPLRASYIEGYQPLSGTLLAMAVLLPVLAGAVAIALRGRVPWASFAVLFFYGTLLPSTRLFAAPAVLAERFLYLPSIVLAIAVAFGLGALRGRARALGTAALALVLAAGTAGTLVRNRDWKSDAALGRAELRADPKSLVGPVQLGMGLYEEGDLEGAERWLAEAVRRGARARDVFNDLGIARARLGRPEGAAWAFEAGLRLDPRDPTLLVNYARMLLQAGRPERAAPLLVTAIEAAPSDYVPYMLLADAFDRTGKPDQARVARERGHALGAPRPGAPPTEPRR